jgi:AcrR family transcriptional regulator
MTSHLFMPKVSPARKDERRRQVLRAATRCFARQGFHRTTIQDICSEAGLSHGAVYRYFDSKDAIIAALSETSRRMGTEQIAAAERRSAPIDQLRLLLSGLAHPDAVIVNQLDVRSWGEAIGDPQLRDIYLTSRAELIEALAGIVAPAARAKRLAPEGLAEVIAALIAGCEVQRAIQPSTDLSALFDALLALLKPDTGSQQP